MSSTQLRNDRSDIGADPLPGVPDASDAELLKRFTTQQDQAAFADLVSRHGPMVLGVCRRILSTEHDAEDAFQATFLVLINKASSLKLHTTLGNWLYGVAYRTALHARHAAVKRRVKEAAMANRSERSTSEDLWCDLLPILDDQLRQLPEKYRAAIILCELEGKTRREAARLLGCPEGTVASRLSRGLDLLAKRLRRYGVAVAAPALAKLLSHNAAASVPAALASSTNKAAVFFVAGRMVSAKVAALTQGVLKAMLITKLKIIVGTALPVVVLLGGGMLTHYRLTPEGLAAETETAASDTKDETKPDAPKKPRLDDGGGRKAGERPSYRPAADEPRDPRRVRSLDEMRALAVATTVRYQHGEGQLKLVDSPVFRYDDQPRRFLDATMWVWTDQGRPVAFQKIEAEPHVWGHCFTSLAERLLEVEWSGHSPYRSTEPGIAFRSLPDAPDVPTRSSMRSLELRNLAREFSARIVVDRDGNSEQMRLLSTPIFEYAEPRSNLVSGAVFGFATNGTNPDLLLVLEARTEPEQNTSRWHFGAARMTIGGVALKHRETTVAEFPYVEPHAAAFPTWTFFPITRQPDEQAAEGTAN